MRIHNNLYINGHWRLAKGEGQIAVTNPATDATIAQVQEASVDDVDSAVKAARDAFPAWAATPAEERAALIQKIADRMLERADELANVIVQELGMPVRFTEDWQVKEPAFGMSTYVERCHLMDKVEDTGSSTITREAIGVCAFITPWNYPLHQIVGKCAPALAAGCTMVLKPSEVTPLNAIIFAEILDEAGLPAGVFNLVHGTGQPVGEALVTHPLVDMVSFTGSTRAGVRIQALAADDVKRVCLELGGKSPYIVTEDADFDAAIKYGVKDVMVNSGQTCTALTRMLLPASRYEEGVEKAKQVVEGLNVGDPFDEKTFVGPMSSRRQQQSVLNYINKGIEEGARLVTGGVELPEGLDKGAYVRPTIFADVNNDMTIAREEIFGPVLCIIPYDDLEQAIAIANDTSYGLSSGVWAKDRDAAVQIGKRLRAGLVHINGGGFNYASPFGGYKQSGNGREWGDEGLYEYIEIKSFNY